MPQLCLNFGTLSSPVPAQFYTAQARRPAVHGGRGNEARLCCFRLVMPSIPSTFSVMKQAGSPKHGGAHSGIKLAFKRYRLMGIDKLQTNCFVSWRRMLHIAWQGAALDTMATRPDQTVMSWHSAQDLQFGPKHEAMGFPSFTFCHTQSTYCKRSW